jgi:hypothetical protein
MGIEGKLLSGRRMRRKKIAGNGLDSGGEDGVQVLVLCLGSMNSASGPGMGGRSGGKSVAGVCGVGLDVLCIQSCLLLLSGI